MVLDTSTTILYVSQAPVCLVNAPRLLDSAFPGWTQAHSGMGNSQHIARTPLWQLPTSSAVQSSTVSKRRVYEDPTEDIEDDSEEPELVSYLEACNGLVSMRQFILEQGCTGLSGGQSCCSSRSASREVVSVLRKPTKQGTITSHFTLL